MNHNSKPVAHRRGNVGVRQWRDGGRTGAIRIHHLGDDKPVPKTRLRPGAVIWAHVPYEEGKGWKTRPAVVADLQGRIVKLFPGSSSNSRWRFSNEFVEVSDPWASGLTRPTGFRRSPIEIDIADVVDVVGVLCDADAMALLTGTRCRRHSSHVAA